MKPSYYFLHPSSGLTWPTDDPHHWLLDHRDDYLLAAVRERLVASPEDRERCLRAALRRCPLVLVRVVADDKIVVHHWSKPATDLRAWAKEHGFNRPGIQVVLVNERTGHAIVHEDGQDVLVDGERVGDTFPWSEYAAKYERRKAEEPGDQDGAPGSATNFIWRGTTPERMTWTVLKSIWRSEALPCPNCDVPLVLVTVNWSRGMLNYRSAMLSRVCLGCRRRFESREENPLGWLTLMLEPHLRPTRLRWWRTFEIDWSDPHPRLR